VLESDWAFGLWSHRRAPGWASDVLTAGLVLDEEHPEARRLRSWGIGYFTRNYLRSWQHNGGAWLHGGSSYNVGMIMPRVIACWASAQADPDVYEVIRRDYGDWLNRHILYMMCEALPNKTRSDAVAWDRNAVKIRTPTINALIVARAYRNPDPYAYLRWMGRDPKGALVNILFHDEALARAPTQAMAAPLAHVFGRRGPGYVQIRSKGWQPDSTVIEFKCGDYIQRDHPNASLSFWLFHKGRLVCQSGTYGGGEHICTYYARSISSNTLLVYQPGEMILANDFVLATKGVKTLSHKGRAVPVMDEPGGQRFTGRANTTKVFTFDEYMRRKTEPSVTGQLFESGDITAFEHAPDYRYAYASGDGTMAYNNPRFCREIAGRRNPPKVDLVTRSLAWLDHKYLVVFDRVNALDPSWRKAWVCHFQGDAKVSGRLIKAEVPGHIETYDGDRVRSTWSNGILKPPDPDDPGRLFIRVFLPKERTIRRVGGDGYECWSLGHNRIPDGWVGGTTGGRYQDIGRWRIEVSPARAAKFDNFLHLLYPTDTRTRKMPPAEMVTARDGKMVGLAVGGWLVMFGRKGQVGRQVVYQAPAGRTEHLAVDLKRGARYIVSGPGDGANRVTASGEGTLRFATEGPGTVQLRLSD
jgi:hypothetical protein